MAAVIWFSALITLTVFSFGFIDPHLSSQLPNIASGNRPLAALIFFVILIVLYSVYLYFLKHAPSWKIIILSAFILVFSYPALTYDMFNYITTAKVLYTYHENPYIVMPIEIPNEPNLAFTRAANKTALYGPVWLAITAAPHYLGGGNIWRTLLVYKIMNMIVYLGFAYFVYRTTKKMTNVLFFALNPLVLIEVIMNGHNDIYMMALALTGGFFGLAASWFVKGATLPLIFVRKKPLVWTYWILTAVFFVVAPIREELYPWYAVWLVTTASLMPVTSHRFIYFFTIVLTFALELRALPYMWMGYYEGPGPVLRAAVTAIPLALFFVWYLWKNTKPV